jgi:ABC-type nitrate/sulfonate/bicarbonate transport system permease component
MANLENVGRRSASQSAASRLKSIPRFLRSNIWLTILIVAAVLAAWEVATQNKWISALLFPAPSTIAARLFKLLGSGELLTNLGVTLARMLIGFVAGSLPAALLGLLMGWLPRVGRVFDPIIAALHPIPKIAIYPLIMVIFGIGEASKQVIIAVSCFFPMLINSLAGVRQISPIHFEVAHNYGASRRHVFTQVVLPGSLPLMISGVRLALNTALHMAIAVEIISANQGLGSMIWFAWETLRVEDLYVALIVISIVGVLMNWTLRRLALRLVPWQKQDSI